MAASVYDLKSFYAGREGRFLRRLIAARLKELWPELRGLRLMGGGYAVPYLRGLMEGTERAFALMPSGAGAHAWPDKEKNLVALSEEGAWPLETESIDRIFLIHSLEHSPVPEHLLQECWRVLKSGGRLMIVVPNRLGLWARADRTPFGRGTPYTAGQLQNHLRACLFIPERLEGALFMPPFRLFFLLRSAYLLESLGRSFFPRLAGLHLVEASKQIYAGAARTRDEKSAKHRISVGNPAAVG